MQEHTEFRDLVCIADSLDWEVLAGVLGFGKVTYRLVQRSSSETTVMPLSIETVVQVLSTDLPRAKSLLVTHRNAWMGIPFN